MTFTAALFRLTAEGIGLAEPARLVPYHRAVMGYRSHDLAWANDHTSLTDVPSDMTVRVANAHVCQSSPGSTVRLMPKVMPATALTPLIPVSAQSTDDGGDV
ncbi:hypothetical protein D3C79_974540 [compost metagenome]